MKRRFHVTHNGLRIASVIAESADEAIRIACMKTGTTREGCVAAEVTAGGSSASGR